MRIAVRVRPGARAEAVGGRWDGPRGEALLVAVRAQAIEGAATAAVAAALADACGVCRAGVTLASGAHSRDLDADDARLRARLEQLLSA